MEKLTLDFGVREYEINGNGILRFNPEDPNLYSRLMTAMGKITAVEKTLVEQAKGIPQDDGEAVLGLMTQADGRVKEILGWVFGPENDFDKLLGGANVMATCGNGERVVANLLAALTPIVKEGAERYAKQLADAAVTEARRARAQR